MATLEDKSLWENQEQDDNDVGQEIIRLAPEEINNRTRLLENDIKVNHTKRSRSIVNYFLGLGYEI
jgi:26S proteasome regulatory subunit T5